MRLVPELAMMLSGICIIGFFVSEMGFSQIPVLYPIGVWLHEYWFADYRERYKRHYGQYAIDGPPLIVVPGDSGPQNWPYAAPGSSNGIPLQYTDQYSEVAHSSSKYTPVDGVGGVVKDTIKDGEQNGSVKYCFPQAQEPNDYIANRFLGKGFGGSYQDLVNVGEAGKAEVEYNKNVFKDGTPFMVAAIGKGLSNDPRWGIRAKYQSTAPGKQLLVPLTTTNVDQNANPQVYGVHQPNRDYSGAEYLTGDPTSLEYQSLTGVGNRPPWYQQDFQGNYLGANPGRSATWNGDDPYITNQQNQVYPYEYIMPEFTTPLNTMSPHGATGWGEPTTGLKSDPSPREMQYNFIETQLMQENPIHSG